MAPRNEMTILKTIAFHNPFFSLPSKTSYSPCSIGLIISVITTKKKRNERRKVIKKKNGKGDLHVGLCLKFFISLKVLTYGELNVNIKNFTRKTKSIAN